MAAKTFGRIDTTVNAMTHQVVSSVGHAAPGISMVFNRRFQIAASPVAIAAKTLLVTHAADRFILNGAVSVTLKKGPGMLIDTKGE